MKKTLLFLSLIFCGTFLTHAQGIFDDTIHTATNFGSVNSPGGEGVQNIIDQNPMTKFLDFNAFDGIGFNVDLLGDAKTAIAIEFVTANDAAERDPTNYEIFGSSDGTNYTSIATGGIPCISTRLFSRTFSFVNTTAYTFYRVNFTGTCGTSGINQIADVQLFESIGDAPTITCPSDIVMDNTTGQCDTSVTYSVTANDTEDGVLTPTLTSGLASGDLFPVGTTEVFMSVTDSDNNTVSCNFSVTIIDAEDPMVDCPDNITETVANAGDTSVAVTYVLTSTDNCALINPLANFTPLTNINGKAYYLSDNAFLPQDAFADAILQGGFVGTIRNDSDNTMITQAISNIGSAGDVLIGYNDVTTEGVFEWQSGDAATYNNWNAGEPNNAGNEDYTVSQSSGGWNDVNNGIAFRYLLEVDYVPFQTAGLASGSDFPIGTTTNTFTITDLAGNAVICSFDVTVDDILNTEDNSFSNSITLFPNPTKDIININSATKISIDNITILDLNGKSLLKISDFSEKFDGNKIDLSKLASGTYFIKIEDSESRIAVKRIIKL